MIKLIHSENATKFCETSILDLSYVVTVKSTAEISQNFVAFSEYMNFTYRVYHIEMDEIKWLLGIEQSIILLDYGAQWLQEVWTFEFH